MTSTGQGAPVGCSAAALWEGLGGHPRAKWSPTALSAACVLKPALPRTKTSLSGTINSQENMPLDKARLFSGLRTVSSTPWVH